jgi:hypothetical protein
MAKTEITAVQIQMAASAGVEILQIEDLSVPLKIAKSGLLGVLEGMLTALAKGEVVLANPEPVENIVEGAGEPPIAPVESEEAEESPGGTD